MNPSAHPSRREWLWLTAVLLIAAILRLGWPGISEFKADEARLYLLALQMKEGQFALRGISSSVGFPNFPMSVWLYTLPLLIWAHPLAATLFTGLLNTLTVGGTYWLTRRYWGPQAALAAALLLAVSPWAVIFSRKIWAQNLLPLFVVLWAAAAMLTFVEKRPSFLPLHLLLLAVCIQIHLAAVALLPVTVILLVRFWRQVTWRQIAVGAVLGVGTAVPFLLYVWQNRASVSLPAGSGTVLSLSLDALRHAAILNLGLDIHSLAGPEAFTTYLAQIPGGDGLDTAVAILWGSLIVGGVGWLLRDVRQQKSTPTAQASLIVLLWLFVPVLVFTPLWTENFIHYFIVLLPAAVIPAGVVLARLAAQRQPAAWLAWGGVGILAGAQVFALATLLIFVNQQATPGGFGTPLSYQLETLAAAQSLQAATGAAEIVVAGVGESPQIDAFPAVWQALLSDTPHRFVDGRRHALFPAHNAVVLLSPDTPEMAAWYRDAATHTQEVPLRTGEGSFLVLGLPGDSAPTADFRYDLPLLLANWVHLQGYDALQPAAVGYSWHLHWRTGDNPDPAAYQIFAHLMDSSGERMAQMDTPAFSPTQWHAGDVVVTRFEFSDFALAGPVTVRTGMYRYPSLEPVLLLDVAGNPFSDAAETRPLPLPVRP